MQNRKCPALGWIDLYTEESMMKEKEKSDEIPGKQKQYEKRDESFTPKTEKIR